MENFYVMQGAILENGWDIALSDYDTAIANTLEDGKSIKDFDLSSFIVDFNKKGDVIPDFFYSSISVPIISYSFKNFILNEIEEKYVEILPIKSNVKSGSIFYILNIIENINCLNKDKSNIEFFEGTSVVKKATEIKLNSKSIGSRKIFRIDELPTDLVLTADLKQKLSSSNLKGFNFIPLNDYKYGF